ncbi:outer membrane beta-barrel protein [uncultured Jannaschia sp.]|uniref:outer membrane protein n=1 Tax=uncultured Jannaschia sp. TaxID=293347 RepID=UPI00261C83CA|nr:outer membrane beta-barrel protein [uncultured Jannaschia sp.]
MANTFRTLRAAAVAAILVAASAGLATAQDIWSGGHIGIGFGVASGGADVTGTRNTYDIGRAANRVTHGDVGPVVELHGGWDWQRGSFVFGLGAAIAASPLGSTVRLPNSGADGAIDVLEIDWTGHVTTRIGYAAGDTLVYVRGGWGAAQVANLGGDIDGGRLDENDAYRSDTVRSGLALGVGFEQRVTERWSLRGELMQIDIPSFRRANRQGAPGSQAYTVENGPIRSATLGLSYRF